MKIGANNISMNYEVSGSGKWLTLIHGAGDNLEAWWNQVPVFSKYYQVLTYDVRGYGNTETPEEGYGIDVLEQDLHELFKKLNIKESYLLGYSMGGRIALHLALNHPEMVRAVIFANSGLVPVYWSKEEIEEMTKWRQQRVMAIKQSGSLEAIITDESIGMAFSPGWPDNNNEVIKRLRQIQLKNDPQAYLITSKALVWGTPPPDASQLKMPVLIIAGEHDVWSDVDYAVEAQRLIPGSKLVIMPTGHASAIERPTEFNQAVLDFLSELG